LPKTYEMTQDEEDVIRRCHSLLDEETIELCQDVASAAANEIVGPEEAQELLLKTLFAIMIRNRMRLARVLGPFRRFNLAHPKLLILRRGGFGLTFI
jgi:hypothetical protein